MVAYISDDSAQQYVGTVKSWVDQNGWGMIRCAETESIYGKDMFFLRTAVANGGVVRSGLQVTFTVEQGNKGPQAANVEVYDTAPTDAQFKGLVKSYNPMKGWGMIQCAQTEMAYGKDVFFMKTAVVGGADVQQGSQVTFSVETGQKGPQGANVAVLGSGGSIPAAFAGGGGGALGGGGEYRGVVKSFVPEKGWGMIQCAQTHQSYNKDMFFMKSDVLGAGTVTSGNQVKFAVVMGAKGPQASNVQVQGLLGGGGAYARAVNPRATPAPSQLSGTVKSWNPEKGWGMIQCPQTEVAYGKDMFFMKTAITGVATVHVGSQVTFVVEMGAKGPQGARVQVVGGAGVRTPIMQTLGGGFVSSTSSAGQTFCGYVKSYDETKGWGFLACDGTQAQYGKDVFMMRSALQGHSCEPGDQVAFTVKIGRKGPEAEELTLLPAGSFGTDESAGAVFQGTVKSYNEEKGWGFIECEDAKIIFKKDIFLHKRECGNESPNQGDAVQFSVSVGTSGKPEAANVNFGRYGAAPTRKGGKGLTRASPY